MAHPSHYDWMLARGTHTPTIHMKALEAVDEATGEIIGMAAVDNLTLNGCEVHFASDNRYALRPLADALFKWVFQQMKKEWIFALTPATSKRKIMRWSSKLGFKELGRVPDGFKKGDDLVLHALHRDDLNWRIR